MFGTPRFEVGEDIGDSNNVNVQMFVYSWIFFVAF